MNHLLPVAALAGIIALPGCATRTVSHGIPNLALVEPGIWRGGQPNDEGWAWLKSQGVPNIIKLNPDSEASDAGAEAIGLNVMRCPVTTSQQFGLTEIPADKFDTALAAVAPGTFIHCFHGQDRTGLFVGLYRERRDGWTRQAARAEMKAHGFHPELVGLSKFWDESNESQTK